jgi:ATP-dependent Clp protease ATP-binding subunit ClpC
VPEPTIDETYEILQGLRERYETHHKLRYTGEMPLPPLAAFTG